MSDFLLSIAWTFIARNRYDDTRICHKLSIKLCLPFFVYGRVRTGWADSICTYSAVMLSEFTENCETYLTFRLFFIVLLIFKGNFWVEKWLLGIVRVYAFFELLFEPKTEAAILNESVSVLDCILWTALFLGDALLILESSCICLLC